MSKTNKRVVTRSVIIGSAVLLFLLGVLALMTKSFVVDAILHIYLRLLLVPIDIKILQKCFKDHITGSMNKVLILCSSVIILDMVIIDAIRFILNNGVSTILFLPACLPICFMIILFYASKDTGRNARAEKILTYIVGIPLLLLSLYFEILSFA